MSSSSEVSSSESSDSEPVVSIDIKAKEEPSEDISNPEQSEEDELSDSEDEEEPQEVNTMPFLMRKSFVFSFFYMFYSTQESDIIPLFEAIKNVVQKILEIDNYTIHIIQGNKEKDRLRVIIPEAIVDVQIAKDLRSLILSDLGYKNTCNIIPALLFELPILPNVLIPRSWDIGEEKWVGHQTYKSFTSDLQTEEIEKMMIRLSHNKSKLTEFTDKYKEFISIRGDDTLVSTDNELSVLQETKLETLAIQDGDIPEELKKELGSDFKKCIDFFGHPDSALRKVRKLDNQIYLFDFTKSNHKCRLCKIVHQSNRQYLTYSKKSRKAFYHCYDSDASDKKLIMSFRKGSNVV
jgi:hypothetical protein